MNAAQELTLDRPLVALDLETTGLDANNDRILEIACVKLWPDGRREVLTRRVNPGVPISPEATAVHGITEADLVNEPRFEALTTELLAFLDGCDLTGFNIEHFDLPMLSREFGRHNISFPVGPTRVIDSWRIYLTKEPRDLAAAYRYYCGKDLVRAHSAEADALAAADILAAQVKRYADLPTSAPGLHDYCHPRKPDWIDPDGRLVWRGDKACLGFGKHKERSLEALATELPDYLRWMAGANFSDQVQSIVKAALRGDFPKREVEATAGAAAPAAERVAHVEAKPRLPSPRTGSQVQLPLLG